jgi:ketosteroid isomerase-like protein
MGDALDTVKRMWIAYREAGVDTALELLDPEVEFQAHDGKVWSGHDGVREFFAQFERSGEEFSAAPYTFEPHGHGVVVAGHRRVGAGADYLYFSHHVRDGTITRVAAWSTRDSAIADVT